MFEDITIGGVVTGVIGTAVSFAIASGFKAYQRWNINDDIAMLQLERKHLEEIKKSSVAMNRSAFRSVFLILTLMAIAQAADAISDLIPGAQWPKVALVTVPWLLVVIAGVTYLRRYDNLRNYEQSILEIDSKLVKLEEKRQKLAN